MNEILHLICEMSPWLLLGFAAAGLMHVYIPASLYSRYLAPRRFRSVVNAAILGVPLPLCSCGVLPTALSLHREGASKGATVSFLIATPQTGVDSILATYSLMGLPFAILRPMAALITALLGGHIANKADKSLAKCPVTVTAAAKEPHSEGGCCHNHEEKQCCHNDKSEKQCCHNGKSEKQCCCGKKENAAHRLKRAMRHSFVDMMDDMGRWLVIGIVVAGLITALVPDNFLAGFTDKPLLGMVLALALSLPMYLCATGSIPIAVALMLKGLSPGAALVMLMAGPACNAASILVVRNALGWRVAASYLAAIIGGAIICGLGVDYLMPREWFTGSLTASCATHDRFTWWGVASAIILAALLAASLLRKMRRKPSASCHCCN